VRQRPAPATALLIGLLAVLAAGWVRGGAVLRLPTDFDEFASLQAGFRYAERMAPGRWSEIPEVTDNGEHPSLVKLAYGAVLKRSGAVEPEWDRVAVASPVPPFAEPAFRGPRILSAVAGVLQVLLEALVSPLGALWLAFDTYHAKYTAQANLEGLPGLFAILAVLLFERALRRREPEGLVPSPPTLSPLPLLLAALMLGLASAGKYPHGLLPGLAFLPFLALRGHDRPWLLAGAGAVMLLAFLAADPYLWPDPIDRLWNSAAYHLQYTQSEQVTRSGSPWWYTLHYLTRSAPARWHPEVFPIGWLDLLLLPVAALGVPSAARHRPVWLAWAVVGLLVLLAWPTKWPQYTLLVRPPLTVLAGLGLVAVKDRLMGGRRVSRL
jgi:4-amino-4-deoxy-L-arabinose transferase-like glycosyltransferase